MYKKTALTYIFFISLQTKEIGWLQGSQQADRKLVSRKKMNCNMTFTSNLNYKLCSIHWQMEFALTLFKLWSLSEQTETANNWLPPLFQDGRSHYTVEAAPWLADKELVHCRPPSFPSEFPASELMNILKMKILYFQTCTLPFSPIKDCYIVNFLFNYKRVTGIQGAYHMLLPHSSSAQYILPV